MVRVPLLILLILGFLACSSRPSQDSGPLALQPPFADPVIEVGAAEAPDAPLKRDIVYLQRTAKKLLEGCIIKASDGTPLYTPDGKAHYAALWTRDFASMVENAGYLMSMRIIEKCIDYLIKGIREDGAVPDRVQADGRPVYAAGSPESPLGEPNIDNAQFLVFAVWSFLDMVPADRHKFLYFPPISRLWHALKLLEIQDQRPLQNSLSSRLQ